LGPDLVVLGLLEEYADAGTGFIAQLRAHPDTHHLPIVVCSGDTERLRRLATRLLAWGCAVVTRPLEGAVFMALEGAVFMAAVRSGLERGSIPIALLPHAA
jgi:CheY-like chemotaxis protein